MERKKVKHKYSIILISYHYNFKKDIKEMCTRLALPITKKQYFAYVSYYMRSTYKITSSLTDKYCEWFSEYKFTSADTFEEVILIANATI